MTEFNFDELVDYFLGDFNVADRMHRNREFGFILRTKGIRTKFGGGRYVLKRMSSEALQMILKKQFDCDFERLKSYNWFFREVLERFGGIGLREIIGHDQVVNDDRFAETELIFHLTILTELFSGYLKRRDFFAAYQIKKGNCHYRRLLGYIAKFPEEEIKEVAIKNCPFPEATLLFWELLKELYGINEKDAKESVRNNILKLYGLPYESPKCWDLVRATETHPLIRKEYHLLKVLFKEASPCPLSISQSYSDEVFRELALRYQVESFIHDHWKRRLGFKNSYSMIGLLDAA